MLCLVNNKCKLNKSVGRRQSLSEHSEFDVLCQRFELVLSHDYDASAIGRRIKGLARDERIKLVGDASGGKANSTLKKRVLKREIFFFGVWDKK